MTRMMLVLQRGDPRRDHSYVTDMKEPDMHRAGLLPEGPDQRAARAGRRLRLVVLGDTSNPVGGLSSARLTASFLLKQAMGCLHK